MAFMWVTGACYCCNRIISFSPSKVPSVPGSLTSTGEKEPVCEDCVARANPERIAKGLPLIEILPGAYDPDEVM